MTERDSTLWTIVSAENRLFAIRVDDVETMVMLSAVSSVPRVPPHVRGVLLLRGKAIPVIDLRLRLGMPSLKVETEELISMLTQREADHRNWLDELELSVKEGREFKLTTDPHECAFGRWYDTFTTDNFLLAELLKRFDAPHKRIHAVADKVLSLEQTHDSSAAQRVLDETRDTDLAVMVGLFGSLRAELKDALREIAVVLAIDGHTFAIAVDSVETVSRLVEGTVDDLQGTGISFTEDGLVTSVGRLDKSNKLVLVLDTARILSPS